MNSLALHGKKIALWGLGKEGHSVLTYLRENIAFSDLVLIDDQQPSAEDLAKLTKNTNITFQTVDAFFAHPDQVDILIKSPGISRYRPEIAMAIERGVEITTPTNLWLHLPHTGKRIVITGTKGKSTTSALLAAMLTDAGYNVTLAGNIGTPLLDTLDNHTKTDFWVIELSSYQLADIDTENAPRIDVGILLNLYPEHIDWHLTHEQYYRDKLHIFTTSCTEKKILNGGDPQIRKRLVDINDPIFFNTNDTCHVDDDVLRDANEKEVIRLDEMQLTGHHNLVNVCAALTAAEELGIAVKEVLPTARRFKGLPHRLEVVCTKDGMTFVDDSIATTPESTIAAIDAFAGKPITLILGGHDRQQDYSVLAERILHDDVHAAITMHQTGPRIAAAIREQRYAEGAKEVTLKEVSDLTAAVQEARNVTSEGGVIILSPAAPSYGVYKNFEERGDHFQSLVS